MSMLQNLSKGGIDTKSVIKKLNKDNFQKIIKNVKDPTLWERFISLFS
jgi:hypothetical protein